MGEEGHDAFLGVAAARDIVLFQHGVFPELRDGVKIEIERVALDQARSEDGLVPEFEEGQPAF